MNNKLNPLELLVVEEDLSRKGIRNYQILPGNACIWVSYGLVNAYYIFNSKSQLVDLQFD